MMIRALTYFRVAYRNLLRNPRRTFAVLLTVSLGTGSLFIFDGFNAGIMNQYRDNTIRSRYGHGQFNTTGYRKQVYEKPWEHWIEDPETLISQIRAVPGVSHVFPRIQFYALITNGEITLSGAGQGVDGIAESDFFNTLNIEEGAALSSQSDGILLGKGLAESLKAKPGDRITVLANTIYGSMNGVDLTVSGVFHTGSKDFDDTVFRIPLDVAQTLLDTKKVESIAIGLENLDDWNRVATTVLSSHPGLDATPFEVLDKVYYQHAVDWLASQFSVIKIIILLIVVLGIFNTISTGVLERKQEVGNLRANGESSNQVLALFMMEGTVLGVLGALIGIVGSVVINATLLGNGILMPPSPGLTRQFHVLIELQAVGALETFVFGSACAIFGTFLASAKVVKMPIGDALRSAR